MVKKNLLNFGAFMLGVYSDNESTLDNLEPLIG